MSDSEDKSDSTAVMPSSQRGAARPDVEQEPPVQQDTRPDQLAIARRFLQEAHVKASPREKKTEFLQSKGLGASDIEKLLAEDAEQSTDAAAAAAATASSLSSQNGTEKSPEAKTAQPSTPPSQGPPQQHRPNASNDRPPIVTYPEFLVKPERQPPLVTRNGIISTLYAFAGLSTILYGTSKYLVGPMVDNLTDARTELHRVAAQRLDTLVTQLESIVSVVPSVATATASRAEHDDSDEDPTEMFHRDVGTQTAPLFDQDIPSTAARPADETASKRQADRLTSLTKTLSVLKDQFRSQSEGFEDIKTLLDVFRDDLDGMAYGGATALMAGYDFYGTSRKKEPEDEIRKVRDSIRRVKGLLLSTRNFPASMR
ncbi:hypothetical protein E4U42_004547 [Claviceps africana]|uniref:Peroxisomal membrane protein PEX14 n=1 Tax=Claviceps africana TaxID=83212 RepID=A0A8K0J7A5_9HYPO|nr:hypothetical protein E4U42_004547 [Claviceps africana]